MWVKADDEGVERRRLPEIKGDPRVFHALRLAERRCCFSATSARIEDHRVVARVDDLRSVVVDDTLQLATHALASVRCRLFGERVSAKAARGKRGHVFRWTAGKEDARRLQQALAGEGHHGRRRRRGRRAERCEVQKKIAVERTAAGVKDGALDVVRAFKATNTSVVQGVRITGGMAKGKFV